MNILLHDSTPAYLCHGGKQVLAQKIYDSLKSLGINVEYARWWDPSQKCDVIHLFACLPAMVRMAHHAGVKVVLTQLVDGITSRSWSRRLCYRFRNYAIRHFFPGNVWRLFPWHILPCMDALVYIHKYDAETAINSYGVPRQKTHIIPHGCDSGEMAKLQVGPRNERSYLVSIGSIIPRKNSVLLARAARRTGIPVVFLGKPFNDEDPYFQEFQHLVDGKRVVYPGYVSESEKIRLLTGASGFVLPSTAESGCIAVYEAAAAGLPLLLSDLPWAYAYGERSAVQHVKLTGDKAFADRLRSFYDTSKRLDGTSFPVLTWKEIAKEYVNVYQSVL